MLRKATMCMIGAALTAGSLSLSSPPLYAQHSADSTVLTIKIDRETRALALPDGSAQKPDNWNQIAFDPTGWENAAPRGADIVTCIQNLVPGWGASPTYWGAYPHYYYLFRRTFTLPQADNYDGSTIDVGSLTGAGMTAAPSTSAR